MAERKFYIYKLTNTTNDKIYIGRTGRSAYTRLHEHASGHCPELKAAISEIGEAAFNVSILQTCKTHKDACILEKFYIKNAAKKGKSMYNVLFNENYKTETRTLFGISIKKMKTKDETSLCKEDFKHIIKKIKGSKEPYIAVELANYDVIIAKR